MKICCVTSVIPEIFYREYGLKPDSRLRHAGMTNNEDFRVKHKLTWLFSLSFFLIMSGAQVCFPVEKGHIPVETVTGRITAMNGFVWNYSYDIGQKDNRVVVHVAINLVPADDVTRPELDRVKDKWEAGIERIWNDRFSLVTLTGERYPVVINVTFSGSRFHHDVIISRSGGGNDELNRGLR